MTSVVTWVKFNVNRISALNCSFFVSPVRSRDAYRSQVLLEMSSAHAEHEERVEQAAAAEGVDVEKIAAEAVDRVPAVDADEGVSDEGVSDEGVRGEEL